MVTFPLSTVWIYLMFRLIREVLLPLQKMLPYFLISSSFEKAPHLGKQRIAMAFAVWNSKHTREILFETCGSTPFWNITKIGVVRHRRFWELKADVWWTKPWIAKLRHEIRCTYEIWAGCPKKDLLEGRSRGVAHVALHSGIAEVPKSRRMCFEKPLGALA